jgi:hypothetical protein
MLGFVTGDSLVPEAVWTVHLWRGTPGVERGSMDCRAGWCIGGVTGCRIGTVKSCSSCQLCAAFLFI